MYMYLNAFFQSIFFHIFQCYWKISWHKIYIRQKDLTQIILTFNDQEIQNILGKGENACNQHFLLFSQCFLPFQKQILIFKLYTFCHLQTLSISPKSTILLCSKDLSIYKINRLITRYRLESQFLFRLHRSQVYSNPMFKPNILGLLTICR